MKTKPKSLYVQYFSQKSEELLYQWITLKNWIVSKNCKEYVMRHREIQFERNWKHLYYYKNFNSTYIISDRFLRFVLGFPVDCGEAGYIIQGLGPVVSGCVNLDNINGFILQLKMKKKLLQYKSVTKFMNQLNTYWV